MRDSLKQWRLQDPSATRQRRVDALGDAIASYEAEFGVITAEELTAQTGVTFGIKVNF